MFLASGTNPLKQDQVEGLLFMPFDDFPAAVFRAHEIGR